VGAAGLKLPPCRAGEVKAGVGHGTARSF